MSLSLPGSPPPTPRLTHCRLSWTTSLPTPARLPRGALVISRFQRVTLLTLCWDQEMANGMAVRAVSSVSHSRRGKPPQPAALRPRGDGAARLAHPGSSGATLACLPPRPAGRPRLGRALASGSPGGLGYRPRLS